MMSGMVGGPQVNDPEDVERWHEQARRRRLLHGCWRQDAKVLQGEMMGLIRADAHGPPDMSSNPFKSTCRELAIHYNDGAVVEHADASAAAVMQAELDAMGWAPIMATVAYDLIGIREMLVRVTQASDGSISLRPVYPDTVLAEGHCDAPDVPLRIEEARERDIGKEDVWTWDVLDITDPANPYYRVEAEIDGKRVDVTELVLGGRFEGATYPYWDGNDPILPYAMYHAKVWPSMWSHTDGMELVDGTLRSAVHWTYFGHTLRHTAYRQRFVIDGTLGGDEVEGANGTKRREAVADPAVILELRTLASEDGSPSPQGARVGSFDAPTDPVAVFEACARYDRKVTTQAGISASDFERTEGDPRSAYALLLSDEGKIRAARSYTEGIRRGDRALLRIVAALLRLPTKGWGVRYPGVPDLMARGQSTTAPLPTPTPQNIGGENNSTEGA